jgi:hypothetical protein
MTIATYLPYVVMIGAIGAISTILLGLRTALANAGWSKHDRATSFRISAVILIGWFLVALALGLADTYKAAPDHVPTIQYGIFIPILIGAWLIWRSPAVGRIIDALPQPWIVGVQLYRALGVIFLILYATNKMPGLFALPAGVGDVTVGLLAPVVALAYARDARRNAGRVTTWNILGILDLVVAITTGFITSPSTLFSYEPPNTLIAIFPLVLIPVYLVPLSVLLHLASLAKLYGWLPYRSKIATAST